MRISATIADWDWLRHNRRHQDEQDDDEAHWRLDAFTRWNDSYIFNTAVGEMFIAVRGNLPVDVASSIEGFLSTFCPAVAQERRLTPPRDPEVWVEEIDYAALPPAEVIRRLALLDEVDFSTFFAILYEYMKDRRDDPLGAQREVVEFFFMWAAAFGQAASKGWGLVVSLC